MRNESLSLYRLGTSTLSRTASRSGGNEGIVGIWHVRCNAVQTKLIVIISEAFQLQKMVAGGDSTEVIPNTAIDRSSFTADVTGRGESHLGTTEKADDRIYYNKCIKSRVML